MVSSDATPAIVAHTVPASTEVKLYLMLLVALYLQDHNQAAEVRRRPPSRARKQAAGATHVGRADDVACGVNVCPLPLWVGGCAGAGGCQARVLDGAHNEPAIAGPAGCQALLCHRTPARATRRLRRRAAVRVVMAWPASREEGVALTGRAKREMGIHGSAAA